MKILNKTLEQVKEFHEVFGHPILETPQIPNENRSQLRVDLLQEELNELKEAIKNKDIVEVADALADLQYVLNGAILEFGLANKFEALHDEVHRSNMSKVCSNKDEADKTIEFYKNKNVEATYKSVETFYLNDFEKPPTNFTYIVYRKEDNKILKSINYSPADLKTIIEQP